MGEEEVQCTTFDRYAEQHGIGPVHFIKSDAEGFDIKVMKGMLGYLESTSPRPVILAELVAEWIHPDLGEMVEVLGRLHALGYPKIDTRKLRWVDDYVLEPDSTPDVGEPGARPSDSKWSNT